MTHVARPPLMNSLRISARRLGLALAAGAMLSVWQVGAAQTPRPAAVPIASLDQLRALRQRAADRPRRIIFNNDGNEPVYFCASPTAAELLRQRTTPLLGSQVDSIFYCTWSSGFSLFTHNTRVGEVFSTREGLFAKNLTPQFLAAGVDPLRVMADFGREHGIEIIWSFRVNDTHDGSTADYGPIMLRANRLKREHPEWLIGGPPGKPKSGPWTAVDFTRPEIRELAFRYVEEVCQNYDVDGVELDFFRHPVFFKRPIHARTGCNDEERGLMTELLRRIRVMTETEGMKRGRPFLLSVRVPDSIEYSRDIGLDLERWLGDGLIDLMAVSGYFQLNDWDYSVALGRKHRVKVYASLDESRVKDVNARNLRMTEAAYRGRAAAVWAAGADGIYMFNSFNPVSPLWRELGDPRSLAKQDQDFFGSVRGLNNAGGNNLPLDAYVRVETLNPARPKNLTPGSKAVATLRVGEGFASAGALKLRVQFAVPPDAARLRVSVNGGALAAPTVVDTWLEFTPPTSALRVGSNRVEVALNSDATNPAAWTDVMLQVRQAAPLPARR